MTQMDGHFHSGLNYLTDNLNTTGKSGIIQLTHVTSSKPAEDDTTLREISFGVQYNSSESKYVFKLSGGIQLKIDGGDYPTIEDNTWYHASYYKTKPYHRPSHIYQ